MEDYYLDYRLFTGSTGRRPSATKHLGGGEPGRRRPAAADPNSALAAFPSVRAISGRLSALSVFDSKSVLWGCFVRARRALDSRKRQFPARAVCERPGGGRAEHTELGQLPAAQLDSGLLRWLPSPQLAIPMQQKLRLGFPS